MGRLNSDEMDFVRNDKTRQYLEFINNNQDIKMKE